MDTVVKRLPDLRAYLDQRLGQVQDHRGWEWPSHHFQVFWSARTDSYSQREGFLEWGRHQQIPRAEKKRWRTQNLCTYCGDVDTKWFLILTISRPSSPLKAMEEGRLSHTYVSSQSAKHLQLCEANDSATASFFRKRTDVSICWPMNFLWCGPIFESTSLCINGGAMNLVYTSLGDIKIENKDKCTKRRKATTLILSLTPSILTKHSPLATPHEPYAIILSGPRSYLFILHIQLTSCVYWRQICIDRNSEEPGTLDTSGGRRSVKVNLSLYVRLLLVYHWYHRQRLRRSVKRTRLASCSSDETKINLRNSPCFPSRACLHRSHPLWCWGWILTYKIRLWIGDHFNFQITSQQWRCPRLYHTKMSLASYFISIFPHPIFSLSHLSSSSRHISIFFHHLF